MRNIQHLFNLFCNTGRSLFRRIFQTDQKTVGRLIKRQAVLLDMRFQHIQIAQTPRPVAQAGAASTNASTASS